ncbi:hypothetical protein AKO1_008289 [Acrasis kona]|uniref:Uncharacterized protein n=1 Tax=Acrasis kona TaxID=1008807 RepID=A0AAW2YMG0_9EUKA
MCFSMEMSAAFAALGLYVSWWVWSKTSNAELARGIFFFFTMEFLQAIQYIFIAPSLDSPLCDRPINKVLTIIGYCHICLQPYFTHSINASLVINQRYLDKYQIIKRLSLIGGAMLFFRFLLSYAWPTTLGNQPSTEWLRGSTICTFRGDYHLAWSVPMADPTYIIPGAAIHSFCMFAPFIALYEKKGMLIEGALLFLTGPVAAGFVTNNLMEQASIWCFFSMAQIGVMIYFINDRLVLIWGREGSLLSKKNLKTINFEDAEDKPVQVLNTLLPSPKKDQ